MVEGEGSMRILFAIYIGLLTGCATVKTTGAENLLFLKEKEMLYIG